MARPESDRSPATDAHASASSERAASPRLTLLIGCTACGKSDVALRLAERSGGEIVSVDSMQVYRRMDIGTAKPTPEERRRVPHHLIDVVEPSESFSVARYVELADAAIADCARRGTPVWAVGGTALYIKALLEGLFEGPPADAAFRTRIRERAAREGSPALHTELAKIDAKSAAKIHPNDIRRIERALEIHHLTGKPISELQQQWDTGQRRHDCRLVCLSRQRDDLNHRINLRVKRMFEAGFVDEVRRLLDEPDPLSREARQALGYAEVIEHLTGGPDLDTTFEQIKIHTRRFAKSQRTWFRTFRPIEWFEIAPDEPAEQAADRIIEQHGSTPPV